MTPKTTPDDMTDQTVLDEMDEKVEKISQDIDDALSHGEPNTDPDAPKFNREQRRGNERMVKKMMTAIKMKQRAKNAKKRTKVG